MGGVGDFLYGVVVLYFFLGVGLVLFEVVVASGVDAFEFFPSEGVGEVDVAGGVGVVGELGVGGDAELVCWYIECFGVEVEAFLLPIFEPFFVFTWWYEVLHFHLFKFAHAEDELAGDDFVAEGFACLGDAEGYFFSGGFLYLVEVDEDSLCGFWA